MLDPGEKSASLCFSCFSSLEVNEVIFRIPIPYRRRNQEKIFILGAGTRYDSAPAAKVIHALKYEGCYPIAKSLAKLIFRHMERSGLMQLIIREEFIIVPIPLHRRRLMDRGYNQAELIGKELSFLTGMPIANLLVRTRLTKEQAKISDQKERMDNTKDCFSPDRRSNISPKGKKILLIDDVFTTGATMFEATKCLYRSGAQLVIGLAAAKA
ncbi:MAG: ComF family protein [Patescibacteria group bacterium]|nr:ComF family protein [Patescibacteria group bacterium]